MSFVVATRLAGGKFLPPYKDIPEDLIQMGGDVIVSKDGSIAFAHADETPFDRPATSSMLNILRAKNAETGRLSST